MLEDDAGDDEEDDETAALDEVVTMLVVGLALLTVGEEDGTADVEIETLEEVVAAAGDIVEVVVTPAEEVPVDPEVSNDGEEEEDDDDAILDELDVADELLVMVLVLVLVVGLIVALDVELDPTLETVEALVVADDVKSPVDVVEITFEEVLISVLVEAVEAVLRVLLGLVVEAEDEVAVGDEETVERVEVLLDNKLDVVATLLDDVVDEAGALDIVLLLVTTCVAVEGDAVDVPELGSS